MLHDAGERPHGRDAVDVEPRNEADGQRDGGESECVHRVLLGGCGLGKEKGEGSGHISMHRRSPEASEQCVSTVAISECCQPSSMGSLYKVHALEAVASWCGFPVAVLLTAFHIHLWQCCLRVAFPSAYTVEYVSDHTSLVFRPYGAAPGERVWGPNGLRVRREYGSR